MKLKVTLLFLIIFAASLIAYLLPLNSITFFSSKPNSISVTTPTASIPVPTEKKLSSEKLLNLVNELRNKNNLKSLIISQNMCRIAKKRLSEIYQNFSHNGFLYYRFCNNCWLGENIAKNFKTENEIIEAWLNSPSELKIIISDATHTCIEIEGSYVVQIFGYF